MSNKNLEELRKRILEHRILLSDKGWLGDWDPPLTSKEKAAINDPFLDAEEDLWCLENFLIKVRETKKLVSEIPNPASSFAYKELIELVNFQKAKDLGQNHTWYNKIDEKEIKVAKVLKKNGVFSEIENKLPQLKEAINKSKQIKEKLLQDLPSLTIDRFGWFAVEGEETIGEDWLTDYRKEKGKVVVEDVLITKSDHKEIREAIINYIKQNPEEWKIGWIRIYDKPIIGETTDCLIVKHKSGKKHWKDGLSDQEWSEVEDAARLYQKSRQTEQYKIFWFATFLAVTSISLLAFIFLFPKKSKHKK